MAGYRVRYTLTAKLVNELVEAAEAASTCSASTSSDTFERRQVIRIGPTLTNESRMFSKIIVMVLLAGVAGARGAARFGTAIKEER